MGFFFRWLAAFIDIHWGDFIGMFFIIYGVRMIMNAHGDAIELGLGQSMLVAGSVLLRPKSGNGQMSAAMKDMERKEDNK